VNMVPSWRPSSSSSLNPTRSNDPGAITLLLLRAIALATL
jgi:hypothetical protein